MHNMLELLSDFKEFLKPRLISYKISHYDCVYEEGEETKHMCGKVSEAVNLLLHEKGDDSWELVEGYFEVSPGFGDTHYWLQNETHILDLTADQFGCENIVFVNKDDIRYQMFDNYGHVLTDEKEVLSWLKMYNNKEYNKINIKSNYLIDDKEDKTYYTLSSNKIFLLLEMEGNNKENLKRIESYFSGVDIKSIDEANSDFEEMTFGAINILLQNIAIAYNSSSISSIPIQIIKDNEMIKHITSLSVDIMEAHIPNFKENLLELKVNNELGCLSNHEKSNIHKKIITNDL